MLARHDLVFHGPEFFGLRWADDKPGRASDFTPESVVAGRKRRAEILKGNPNAVLIAEIRYRDAGDGRRAATSYSTSPARYTENTSRRRRGPP
jgi:hypothetical protein